MDDISVIRVQLSTDHVMGGVVKDLGDERYKSATRRPECEWVRVSHTPTHTQSCTQANLKNSIEFPPRVCLVATIPWHEKKQTDRRDWTYNLPLFSSLSPRGDYRKNNTDPGSPRLHQGTMMRTTFKTTSIRVTGAQHTHPTYISIKSETVGDVWWCPWVGVMDI